MKKVSLLVAVLMIASLVFAAIPFSPPAGATQFSDPNMEKVWNRTDMPVASQKVSRTWMWGPESFNTTQEPYAEAPGGVRTVTYFDKSRMEVTNPNGDRNSQWFVTNGLLAKELITGQMQKGDSSFETKSPANIPVAGDPDDVNGPTYATFGKLLSPGAERKASVVETVDRAGSIGKNDALSSYTDYVYFVPETGHNVPRVFWDFLNSNSLVYDGNYKDGRLFDPTFFATGFPISEAYWAKVKVAGQEKNVLVQAYERRVLTYTPANSRGWQVEMGNVGRHYYDWRYNNGGGDQTESFADVPAAINGSVMPKGGPTGTHIVGLVKKFAAGEKINYSLTGPNGVQKSLTIEDLISGSSANATAGGRAYVGLKIDSLEPGMWGLVATGADSGNQAILYFKATSGGQAGSWEAGYPVDIPNPVNGSLLKKSGTRGNHFVGLAWGFTPGEQIEVHLTPPSGNTRAPARPMATADDDGWLVAAWTSGDLWDGLWVVTYHGITSGNDAVFRFELTTGVEDNSAAFPDVPVSVSGSVYPKGGQLGTWFTASLWGFKPWEHVGIWLTAPNGAMWGTDKPLQVQGSGSFTNVAIPSAATIPWGWSREQFFVLPLVDMMPGVWTLVAEGASTKHQCVLYFKILPDGDSGPDLFPNVKAPVDASVTPKGGPVGTYLSVDVWGFLPGEEVSYWFNTPDDQVRGGINTFIMREWGGNTGSRSNLCFSTANLSPGSWSIVLQGQNSKHTSIVYFEMTE